MTEVYPLLNLGNFQLFNRLTDTVKKNCKIYGRITGNQLPVPVPLFLREPVKISHIAGQDRTR